VEGPLKEGGSFTFLSFLKREGEGRKADGRKNRFHGKKGGRKRGGEGLTSGAFERRAPLENSARSARKSWSEKNKKKEEGPPISGKKGKGKATAPFRISGKRREVEFEQRDAEAGPKKREEGKGEANGYPPRKKKKKKRGKKAFVVPTKGGEGGGRESTPRLVQEKGKREMGESIRPIPLRGGRGKGDTSYSFPILFY